jgi:hypothetical protein
MTSTRVLLTLDLILHKDAAEVPGVLRDVWEETPDVFPEVAAALPTTYHARPAAVGRRGVVGLSIAEQSVSAGRPNRPGESKPAYFVSVTGALAIDPVEGANFSSERVQEDVERFARYVFQLDDEEHGRPAPEIAGSRVTGLKADVES